MNSSLKATRRKEKEYIIKEMIGKGSFGEVEKCEHKESSKIYAIKTIQIEKIFIESIEDEAINMLKVKSEYVLELFDHFYDDDLGSYVLVTPYYRNGSFETLMSKEWEFEELLLFFYQIAKGLFDLSKKDILHLDLKPENILIKSPGQYVLCDLGCARKMEGNMTGSKSFCVLKMSSSGKGAGTADYASPDLVIDGQMTPFTDIWSLGVILYKVIYRHHPLYKISKTQLNKNTDEFYSGRFQIPYPDSPKFKSIIPILQRMLVCSSNKQKRLNWQAILISIMKLLHAPIQKAEYIVTNFDSLLIFTSKVSVATSAIIYYYSQIQKLIRGNNFDAKHIIKNICIFLITLTKELMAHIKNSGYYENYHFYLFKTTKHHLTKKQISFAENLEAEATQLANLHEVPVEIGSFNICRERLIGDIGKFCQKLKGIAKPENAIEKIQLGKLIIICEFIGFKNELKYENRTHLVAFVRELINC